MTTASAEPHGSVAPTFPPRFGIKYETVRVYKSRRAVQGQPDGHRWYKDLQLRLGTGPRGGGRVLEGGAVEGGAAEGGPSPWWTAGTRTWPGSRRCRS